MAKLASTIVQGDLQVTDYLTLSNIGTSKTSYALFYDISTGRVTYEACINVPGDIPGFTITNPSFNDILVYSSDNNWHNTADIKWDSSYYTTAPTIGGISNNTNLYGKTLKEVLYKLLYQYNAPNATLSGNPTSGTYEKGVNSTKLSNIVLTWSTDNNAYPFSKLTNVTLSKSTGGNMINTNLPNVNSSSGSHTDTSVIQDWSNTTYTLSIINDYIEVTQPAKTASINYNYYYRSYYGNIVGTKTLATLTSDDIKGLTSSAIRSKSNLTYTFNNPSALVIKYVYAYPDTISAPDNYGTLSSIIDQNGFNITTSFETGYVNVTLDQGSIRYRVYIKTVAVSTTSYKITFNV